MGVAIGWVPYDPDKLAAPPWVLAVAGIMFIAGGGVVLASMFPPLERLGPATGFVVLLALAAIVNWVAFGGGARRFSGAISIPGAISRLPVSEATGRLWFAIFAGLLDTFVAYTGWQRLRRIRARIQGHTS